MSIYFLIKVLLLHLSLFLVVKANNDVKILSSTEDQLTIEYTPLYLSIDSIRFDNQLYFEIDLHNGIYFNSNKNGISSIQKRILNVGVPTEFGNIIKILSSESQILYGKIKPGLVSLQNKRYEELDTLNNIDEPDISSFEIVNFGESGKVRDLFVQNIDISPIRANTEKNEIRIFSRIVFQIRFNPSHEIFKISQSDLTNNLVINSEYIKKWSTTNKLLKSRSIKNSVLAKGDWYRFEVPNEGIFKINKDYLLNLNIDVDEIDPRTIKIYNNGGYILPWNPNSSRPNDLVEIAIKVRGESDGSFDNSDEIIFYGRGVDYWEYNNISDKITRNKHFYSKNNYYWLTFGGEQGKRMRVQETEIGMPVFIQSTTRSFKFRDNDNRNLMNSGLLFIDDEYSNSNNSKTYVTTLEGQLNGSPIKYSFQFVNGSGKSNLLTIEENGNQIFSNLIVGSYSYFRDYRYGALTKTSTEFLGSIQDSRSVLKFSYNPTSISDRGHLDYFEIEYTQDMGAPLQGTPLIFFSAELNGMINYRASTFNDSNFKLYNISQYEETKIVNFDYNGGNINFNRIELANSPSKYIAIHDDDVKIPSNAIKITNSNLHGISLGAKYVIITPKEFEEQAVRLKNYRSSEASIKTSGFVAIIDEIFNEFSNGALDPTAIRDFLMYAYENWEIKPEYVLLFGDGDFDYFNTLGKDLNFIPTFQTVESLFEIDSYPFDDFYSRISGDDRLADIAIGRLSVTNIDEAKIVVDKIIHYETNQNKGLWRNLITLLADDGLTDDGNDGSLHTRQSENLSQLYIPNYFDQKKIYLSNYQTINTGLGRRKPDCNIAIIDAINNGTLIFNYIGHGNPDVWAHEKVFDRSTSIPQLKNEKLFFLTAATCDFGKYDDPNLQSATEEMILMEDAGIIGGLSAARPVFSGQNAALNQVFYSYMLREKDSLGYPIPIGKAYHKLKQQRSRDNDEKFHLFADPLLRLNIPKVPIKIVSINDVEGNDSVQIKALSNVSIEGRIFNTNGSESNISGEGIISVFDSEKNIYLDDINYNMIDQGGVLFRGRVSVTDGIFSTSFTVPKDISYENKNGKVTAYFYNEDIDGVGIANNIFIGGTDSSSTNDGSGPKIDIILDGSDNSYLVNSNFNLIVNLYDESGLNTSGTGIGHKLEAILNEQEHNSIDLTNYFLGELDSGGKSGEVNYNFSNLSLGDYKIRINAWDVYNNLGAEEKFFSVVDGNELAIRDVYNYPNPFSSNTYFTFQHNLNQPINVKIIIYTIAGRKIKKISIKNIEDKFVKIEWDGRDGDDHLIGNGTYLYKLVVESVENDFKENILGKLVVLK